MAGGGGSLSSLPGSLTRRGWGGCAHFILEVQIKGIVNKVGMQAKIETTQAAPPTPHDCTVIRAIQAAPPTPMIVLGSRQSRLPLPLPMIARQSKLPLPLP